MPEPIPPSAPAKGTDAAPFKKNVVVALAILTAVSFITGLLFAMLGPGPSEVRSRRADTFSRSAVGHHALLRLLKATDVPVSVSRARTTQKAGAGTVLLLLEPQRSVSDPTADDLPVILRDSAARDVIVVLPKWDPWGFHTRFDWIESVDPVPPTRVSGVLDAARVEADLRDGDGAFTAGPFSSLTPTITAPRVLAGLPAVVSDGTGALVARTQAYGKSIWLISDPDLFNNMGLLEGDNAAFTLALLEHIAGDRALIIDETLHGYTIVEGVWPRLFEFPLVLTTAQVGLVLLLVVLAGVRRFGPPHADTLALGRGRAVLISNTARLLWYGGHSAGVLDQYWQATVRAVRHGVHAPANLEGEPLWRWLDRVGAARGLDQTAVELAEAVRAVDDADGPGILARARAIAAWRAGMLAEEGLSGSRRPSSSA